MTILNNLPELPEGYYWRFGGNMSFEKLELVQRRWFWFPKVVYYQYIDLLFRYPEDTEEAIEGAASLAWGIEGQ